MIVANFKMNKTNKEIKDYMKILKNANFNFKDVVICPSFIGLETAVKLKPDGVEIGAQDVSCFDEGSFTGEVSGNMIKDIGVKYVIVGHSERRNMHYETDEIVASKTISAIKNGLVPIICVGESLKEKNANMTKTVVYSQLEKVLTKIKNLSNNYIIAYEPYWAIGSGKTPTKSEIDEVCSFIYQSACAIDERNLNKTDILYGGSVNEKNAKEIFSIKSVNGALIGSASLSAVNFIKIIEVYNESK
ncbi:MAG: triose-phosphate isomerase [Clostridia bacterium]